MTSYDLSPDWQLLMEAQVSEVLQNYGLPWSEWTFDATKALRARIVALETEAREAKRDFATELSDQGLIARLERQEDELRRQHEVIDAALAVIPFVRGRTAWEGEKALMQKLDRLLDQYRPTKNEVRGILKDFERAE